MDPISEERHPIIQLIITNDLDKLKTLLKVEDINKLYPCKEVKDSVSPLSAAVIFHRMDICDFLLTKGADPEWVVNGLSPVDHACKSAPVEFVRRLIKAGARISLCDPRTNLTPLHIAALHDRLDVMKVLIDAGSITDPAPQTHPQHRIINYKISKLVDELSSSGEEMYSKMKLFHDVAMASYQKAPREVFEMFGRHMLEEDPLTHLTLIHGMFNFVGPPAEEYQQKCITWLKDNNKLNFYIENVVKRFQNMIYHFPHTAVIRLQVILNTLEEIPSETSLTLIPQLLEHLSLRNKWPQILPDVLSTLYVITGKTKVNDNWNQDFINTLCTAIVPFVGNNHSQHVRMYTYATLANLLPFVHTSYFFASKGINHVPEDVIMFARIQNKEVMVDKLKQLDKHLSKQTPETETTNTEPSKQPREWNRISKRWSQQLEKLVNEDVKVVKVGNVVMGKGGEFRIAGGSDGTQVFLGLRDDGTEVAVKRMTPENYEVLKNEKDFLRLPELDDPSIVRYVDFKEDENYGYLVLQLCEYTLEEYIKKGIEFPGGPLPEQAIAQQVLTSLKILHHQNPSILHRDIKPQNVLIDVTRKARLADFGISRRLTSGQTTHFTSSAGTKCWRAKETINEDDGDERVPYKRSADIQVAGMLLYYILSGGHHPFGRSVECEYNIYKGLYKLHHVQDVVAKDLIKMMINEDPQKRPTVEECLDHPYFWENEKRVDFLRKVATETEMDQFHKNPEDVQSNLMTVLDQCAEKGLFDEWKGKMRDKLPKEVFAQMERRNRRFPYRDDGFGLLRFIQNLYRHHKPAAEKLDLTEMFPGLIVSVYMFVKELRWNTRRDLKGFYKNTNLKDSDGSSLDGALSELSLQSP